MKLSGFQKRGGKKGGGRGRSRVGIEGRSRWIRVIGEVIFSLAALGNAASAPARRKTCSPVIQGQTSYPLPARTSNSGNNVRLFTGRTERAGVAGARLSFSFPGPRLVTVHPFYLAEVDSGGESRSCSPTDSRTTFIACRIYGVFASAAETHGQV